MEDFVGRPDGDTKHVWGQETHNTSPPAHSIDNSFQSPSQVVSRLFPVTTITVTLLEFCHICLWIDGWNIPYSTLNVSHIDSRNALTAFSVQRRSILSWWDAYMSLSCLIRHPQNPRHTFRSIKALSVPSSWASKTVRQVFAGMWKWFRFVDELLRFSSIFIDIAEGQEILGSEIELKIVSSEVTWGHWWVWKLECWFFMQVEFCRRGCHSHLKVYPSKSFSHSAPDRGQYLLECPIIRYLSGLHMVPSPSFPAPADSCTGGSSNTLATLPCLLVVCLSFLFCFSALEVSHDDSLKISQWFSASDCLVCWSCTCCQLAHDFTEATKQRSHLSSQGLADFQTFRKPTRCFYGLCKMVNQEVCTHGQWT